MEGGSIVSAILDGWLGSTKASEWSPLDEGIVYVPTIRIDSRTASSTGPRTLLHRIPGQMVLWTKSTSQESSPYSIRSSIPQMAPKSYTRCRKEASPHHRRWHPQRRRACHLVTPSCITIHPTHRSRTTLRHINLSLIFEVCPSILSQKLHYVEDLSPVQLRRMVQRRPKWHPTTQQVGRTSRSYLIL